MTKNAQFFDIIIAGAGPAGLSLASELSHNFTVCVIDKGKIGTSEKSWDTYWDRVKKLGLEEAVVNRELNIFEFGHFLGARWPIHDCFCQLDEQKLLEIFINRCEKKNTTFLSDFEIVDYTRDGDTMKMLGKKKSVSGRLIIDCMGAESPITKNNVGPDYTSYTLLGYKMTQTDINPHTSLWIYLDAPESPGLIFGGIMPYSRDYAQIHVLSYDHNRICEYAYLEPYLEKFLATYPGLQNAKIESDSRGKMIMGVSEKNASDGVFLFGESSHWTPRLIGMGFNQIMLDYKKVARELSKLLKKNQLTSKDLSQIKGKIQDKKVDHFLACFEKIIFSLKDSPEKSNRFMQMMSESDPQFGKCWMRNEFDLAAIRKSWSIIHSHFSVHEIFGILPKQDIVILIEFGLELLEDTILENYKKILKEWGKGYRRLK